jgi:hypothetical protein
MIGSKGFSALMAGSAVVVSSAACAETQIGADLSADGGYATNPFSSGSGSAGSATVTVGITPFIALLSPAGSTRITGDIRRTEYSRRYDGQTDYSGGIASNLQLSPRTSLTGSVSYASRVINALNPIANPLNPLPLDPNVPIIIDPTTSGIFQQRTKTLSGGLQLSQQLSARDTITLNANTAITRFGNSTLVQSDYDYYGGGIGYQRVIGANTSIGANVGLGRTTYRRSGFGSTTSISPALTFATKLSPRLTLNADAGVTFTDTDVAGGSRRFTAPSGSISLCDTGSRANFCVQAARTIAPSAFNGVSRQTTFGLRHSYQLDPRSQLTTSVNYGRQSGVAGISRQQTLDYGMASIGYNRQLTRRLSAVATVSYADSFKSVAARRANFYGSVGVRYRIGDVR